MGDWLTSPVSRAGIQAELDKPIVGNFLSSYISGEVAADHTTGSWKPDFRVTGGLKLTF